MKVKEFIESFEQMSAKDQTAVRDSLLKRGSAESCCSGPDKKQLMKMMETMETSKDPMAMCMEMMRMCGEKMSDESARKV